MIRRFTAIAWLILCGFQVFSQPGKNGPVTITSSNTVVNSYSAITANVAAGTSAVTVNSVATELGGLAAGDLIMLYQAQGATIQTTNDNDYGAILAYNNAGRYEYAYVVSVAGNTVTVGCAFKQSYTAAGRAQVVKVPQYSNLTIGAGGSIVPLKWNGARGGIVAVHVSGTLTNNGTISAEGSGFRGGKRDNLTSGAGSGVVTMYRDPSSGLGAEKGESIAGYQADYDAAGMGGRYGRGAPANGGGGGNGHNAAGGGGSNGDNGNAWTGAGVMDPNPLYLPAWQLDPDFIANGNALTNSSGGGRGGYTYAANNVSPFTYGPGDPAWGGDYRDAVGGRGGRPLSTIVESRIFMGGGGGAGDGNNNASNDGGDGGGIVYITANTITGTGLITAAGQAGYNTVPNHNDAPGGGGGGGTIIIKAFSFTGQTLNANGGSGGNQLITNNESEGCAGGGGGGFIGIPTSGVGSCGVTNTYNYIFGTNGTSTSPSAALFPPNGGTLGASGQNNIPVSPYFIPYTLTCLIDGDGDGVADGTADADEDNDGIADINESFASVDPSADADSDNIPNYADPSFSPYSDTNCDGVNDYFDFDLDGIPDFQDLDSDNDGITDCLEAGGNDANKDGIVDGFVDADGNGLSDALGAGLVPGDLDGDTRRSFRDRDSDGDGITDLIEAGGVDANGDGIIDGITDTDKDGYANSVDPTTNNRALTGANASSGVPLTIPDTDGDSKRDFLDIDSDNDGITDNIEAQTTVGYVAPVNSDSDGDGIANVYDAVPVVPVNTDGTDTPDYIDADSDNDGVPDSIEGHDANSDGIPVPALPVTGDSDGDGLLDGYDLLPSANVTASGLGGTGSFAPLQDTDGDGRRDWRDTDDDGDCTLTATTGGAGENANGNASWADDFTQGGGTIPNYLYATNTLTVTNGTRCGTGSVALSAAAASTGTFRWYSALTGGTLLQTTTTATSSTYNTASISANTTYYVEFENGVCTTAPRKAVVATVVSAGSTPTVTAASRCNPGTLTLQASAGSAGTFRWYAAASGGTPLQTTPAVTSSSYTTPSIAATTTYYVSFDNGTCESGRAAVTATITSASTVTVTNAATCGGTTATLSASSGAAGTFNWYDAATGGLLLHTQGGVANSSYTTPSITASTTYYVEFDNGGCVSPRTAVTATVSPALTAPAVTNSTICGTGTASLSATYGSAGTFRWYSAASGGTPLHTTTGATSSNYTTPSISANTTYYVEYSNGTCTSARVPVTAYVVASTIITPINASRCGNGAITVGASSPISGTFNWYSNSSGGTALFTSTGTVSSYATTISAPTTTFYVSFTTTSPACTTPRVAVVATAGTSTTVTGTDGIACSPGTVTIGATAGASGTFRWYANSTGGSALATTTASTTSSFTTPFLMATTDYYVEFDNGVCISSPRTVVRAAIVNDLTTTDGTRCGNGTVTLYVSSLTSGTFSWWSAPTGGTALKSSTTGLTDSYTTPSISATTTYYVSVTTGSPSSCTSGRIPVVATVIPTPAQPTAINGSRCGAGTVTLGASSPIAGTMRWYDASSGGTLLQTDNTTTLSTFVTPSISSTTNYWVEFDNGGCTSTRRQVTATVNTGVAPAAPATTAASICGPGTVALAASSSSSGTFRWFTAATGGTLLQTTTGSTSSTFNTPSISSSTTYYVEFDNGTCVSSARAAVTATINTVPAQPVAASVSRCGNGTVSLTATSTTSGTFNWYSTPTLGAPLQTTSSSTSSSYTTPTLSATTTYYVEFSNGSCTSSPRVAVSAIINSLPVAPSVTNGSTCGTGTVVLSASATSIGTFRWYDASSGGNLLATYPSTSSASFTTPSISINTNYYVEFDNGTCTSTRSLVTASVLSVPSAPAVTSGGVCGSGTVTLGASSGSSGTFRWYSAASGGTLLETDAAVTTSSFTTPGITATTIYYVEFDNGTCSSSRVAVTATVNPNPVISNVVTGCTGIAGNGTIAITATIAAGALEYSMDGTTFQASPNFTGLANNTYTLYVRSAATLCVVSQAGVVVKCNVPPTVSNKSATTSEDSSVSGDVTGAGDVDADGTALTVNTTPVVAPVNGSIVLNANGTYTYTPNAGFSGTETITFQVCDAGSPLPAACVDRTLTITINSVNDEPSFVKGANQIVNEDAGAQTVTNWATSINKGGAEESAQVLTFTVTNDNNGLFSAQPAINATGTLTYTPAANANGTATVSVVLTDNGGTANGGDDTFATQTFTITVNAVNDEPTFVKGADQNINEDAGAQTLTNWATAISKGPANESSQVLTFTLTNNNNALFTVQPSINAATGTLTYTPAAGASGVATVTVVLADDGGTANGGDNSSTQTFTITINSVNDEPSFVKGANQIVNEDAGAQTVTNWATSISKGGAEESAQVLTFTVTNDNNGLFSTQPAINAATGTLTYTPAANANGTATVSVVLTDNGGTANGGDDTFATQTFTITVNAVNDEPTFVKGADQTINEDAGAQTLTNWATAISKGPANESSQVLTFTVTNNNNSLFTVQPSLNVATGTLTYTPAAGASGVATVTVVLADDGGTANGGDNSSTQTFTITINSVNDEPSFVKGANQIVNEDAGAQTVTNWATSINKGGAEESAQVLTFTVTNDNNGLFSAQPAINATGTLTYTPAANANGTATVSVVLTDNGGTANGGDDTFATQTFTITVNAVNDEPTFVKGADQNINEDAGAQTLTNWATAISKGPANESSQVLTFTLTNNNNALFTVQPSINAATGTLTYTPAAGASGVATVTVVLADDGGTANGGDNSSTQTFTITINSVNDEPSFVKGANQIVNEDAGAQTVTNWATSISKGGAEESAQVLTFTVTNDNNGLFSTQPAINAATGTLTYTPAANANGTATVSVVLTDNGGTANGGDDTFATQTFTITVNAVNDEPTFVKGADQTINEDAGAQTLTNWATAISKGPANESSQVLTFTVTNNNNSLFTVQPSLNVATGTLTYTPAAGASGVATVTVVLADDGGTANGGDNSSTQTFTITINSVNDEPSFVKGANQIVNEDAGAQTVTNWATSISKGGAEESAQVLTFTVTNDNNGLFSTQPAINAATGTLTYTPAANANGTATVSVVLTDNGGTANGGDDTFATQTFTITVNAVNDEPTFVKGADQTINEDAGAQTVTNWATAISKGPANESSQVLTFTVTNNNNSLFTVQPSLNVATGTLTYTPAAGASGVATVTVVLADDGGTANGGDNSSTQTFTITINSVNDEPSFVKGANQIVNEDAGAQTVTNWATSINKGGAEESAQVLTFTVTNDNNGLFSTQPAINAATGTLTYTPAANANGTATVSVVLTDNGGTANGGDDTFATQTFTITVNAVNDEPTFVKGADQNINEDAGAQTVTNWATAISKGPANESSQVLTFTVTNNNNSLFTVQPSLNVATGTLTYTPAAGASGVATVTVVLADDGGTANGGDNSSTQTFTITINSVNDEPSFVKGANQIVNEDAGAQTVTNWATSISKGGAEESAQVLTFTVTNDNNGLFSTQPAINAATGTLTYTPAANANGTATVSVVLTDNGGTANGGDDTFATQTFTITVNAVNDEPTFVKGADQTINEDAGAQTVTNWATAISKGPANESSQVLTFTVTNNNNSLFTVQPSLNVATGTLTYTPAAGASGVATVTVVLADDGGTANGGDNSSTQTFTITINSVNDEPSFVKGANQIVNEDAGAQTVTNWATSINKGGAEESAQVLTFTVTNDNNGLFSTQPAINAATGTLTYTPAANANGTATVSVVLTDNGGTANGGDDTFATQTFTITVNAVNDEPTFVKGADQTINEDAGAQTVTNWATAISKGPANESSQVLTFTVTNNNNSLFTVQPSLNVATGTLTYTPAAGASGVATVTVVLADDGGTANGGDNSSTQTFTITINSVNDEPSFVKGANQIVNEDAGAQTVTNWATSINKGGAEESAQVLTFTVTNDNNSLFSVQPAIDASGTLSYVLAANANGLATVSVVLSDDGGSANGGDDTFATQTFTITVLPVNDAPTFVKGADQTVDEDAGAQTISNWATAITAGPANESSQNITFSLSNDNNALFSVQPVIDAGGNLTFTSAPDAYGVAVVTIVITDDGGTANGGNNTTTQTFVISVNSVNDKPLAVADNASTDEDTPLTHQVASNDTDIDGTVDPATVDLNPGTPAIDQTVTRPEGIWSVNNTGLITFTPTANYFGTASITYTIRDNDGAISVPGTITVTVLPVNDPAQIGADNPVTNEDTALSFNITNNDTDVDGTVDVTSVDLDQATPGIQKSITNAAGTWTVDNSGNVTFTPTLNFNGTATIAYTVNDDAGAVSVPGNISVTVNPVNDNPVAIADSFTTGEDLGLTFNPTTNDTDVDGMIEVSTVDLDPGTAGIQRTITTGQGLWTVDAAGAISFGPKVNYNGPASVNYTVQDTEGATSNAVTISVLVTPVNDEPILVDKTALVTQGRGATDNLLVGAIDPDGTPLVLNTTPVSGPSHGSITIKADGTYVYIADATFTGTDEIVVEVCDAGLPLPGICAYMTLRVTIVSNQGPTLTTKRQTTAEDNEVKGSVLSASDVDPEGLPLKVVTTPVVGPEHGTIVLGDDGEFTYTPHENYHGKDTVTVSVCDSSPVPACESMDMIFTITPVNDAPVLTDEDILVDRNGATTGNILAGDSDPDGTALIVNTVPITPPAHGTFTIDASGAFTYTPDQNFVGEDQVVIEVCDSGDPLPGLCATTTITIQIVDPLAGVIHIPEGFSPNGDNVNDSFVITYTGPERIQLEVFNRWGNIVYKNEAYQNDWRGVSTLGIKVGEELPDGTYFYKVTIGEFKQVKSFTLKR